ncbi:Transglutaminase-like enzyme, putative cysteine protease [Mesobacillus persicus]|uniref:Transglutaminase-like enzyme, putative cysteine protease n=1 Tax=Mesobacillus persicus TaxID=930146 RepID=A0A1H8KG76_9BACI|nr:Transglutaminase-like enzyme, putative cysteine protease [Mesobacillus persicus]
MSVRREKTDFTTFLVYAFSFLLLWEWLRPVQQLTDTGQMGVFLGFILLALVLSFLKVPFLVSQFIKGIYILYMILAIYYDGIFSLSSIIFFLQGLKGNFSLVWNGQFMDLSNSFRTLLFFILLWMMAYLIQYWLVKRKRIFVFFFITLVFITVLDTFTTYEANVAIVRTISVGFAVMGLLTASRLIDTKAVANHTIFKRKWMISLVSMVALSVLIGYLAPKADPIWPDPVAGIKSYNPKSGVGNSGEKSAGYGTDDSNLGGPFTGDDSIVFNAEVDESHYWKVETKDVYTGKGWVSSTGDEQSFDISPEDVPILSVYDSVPSEERTSTVFNVIRYPHIQYPQGLKEIETDEHYSFRMNPITEKITTIQDIAPEPIESYTVYFRDPSYQVEDLKKSTSQAESNYDSVKEWYTQLPDDLPPSISELALEITEEEETSFDKARAIEQYFQVNSYVYDQVNVAVPEEGDDYVAQFLFETKRGYCDNFSTSMAVMLRTLDIPTRWVKGYTGGELIERLDSGRRIYEVTNNNAHSWVEVFFPEVGWVPFEPTRGFSNNIVFETDNSTETTPERPEAQPASAPTPAEREMENMDEELGSSNRSFNSWLEDRQKDFLENWKLLTGIVMLIAGLAFFGYRKRKRWLPIYYILIYRLRKKDQYFPDAYLTLLAQLDRFGLKRKQGSTLREYAKYVDSFFVSNEMRILTDRYEQYLYRDLLKEGVWIDSKKEWEALMKKTAT